MSIESADNILHVKNSTMRISRVEVGQTLSVGNIEFENTTTLTSVTSNGNNTTPYTISSSNVTTGLATTANVVVGGELTVSGNTTVSSNLEVGTANLYVDTTTGRVGVGTNAPMGTLDVKGVLNHTQVANVAQITSNSNVVMEYRRSKKLIKYPRVYLTSAALNSAYENGYKVTFSREAAASNYRAYHAFSLDETNNVGWHTNDGTGSTIEYNGTDGAYSGTTRLATETELGEWIGLELPEAIKLMNVNMASQSYSPSSNTVDNFIVYAKKQSGDTWTSLGTFTGVAVYQNSAAGVTVNVDTNDYYKFFAIVVTKRFEGGATRGISIRRLDLYGLPEYDPEAHGTDVVLHTTPNVPKLDFSNVYYDGQDYTSMPATVADKSGNGVTGTPSGGVGFDTTYKAFTFDGVDDQITATDVGFSGEQNLCMSGWLKTNSSGEVANMGIGTYTAARCMFFNVNNSVNSYYIVCNAHNNTYTGTFSPNTWIHVSIVYLGGNISGATLLLYINGELQGPSIGAADTTPLNLPSPCPLNLGKTINGTYKAGSIANFRLYNRALSADEIWELYAYQKEYFGLGDLSMTLKAGRVGIGTSEPRAVLDVRGDIRGVNATTSIAAWSVSSTTSITSASSTTIEWTDVQYNVGGCYTNPNFTAPISGYYYHSFHMISRNDNTSISVMYYINDVNVDPINGWGAYDNASNNDNGGFRNVAGSWIIYLHAGDRLKMVLKSGTMNSNNNRWSGFFLSV